jgi:CDP-diacylglycerol pyrophosphatase
MILRGLLWALGVISVATTAAPKLADSPLPPGSLFQVVQICEQMEILAKNPFPCLKVTLDNHPNPGFAVVPSPGEADILLVPLKKLSGIESPELLDEGSPNWWKLAWNVRFLLVERIQRRLSRSDIGMAINSREARSQDQLHIHVACVGPSIRDKIAPLERAITRTWSVFPIRLTARSWWAMRVEEEDLETNPFRLLADLISISSGTMGDWGIAVLAWTFADGSDGFFVFATRDDAVERESGSGAALLDTECTARGN